MIRKPDKYASPEVFFFLAFGLFLTFTVLATSLYYRYLRGAPFKLMYVACVGLLFLGELHYARTSRRELIGLVIAAVLFGIGILVSDGGLQVSIPCIFMFCYCARRISFDKIARFTLYLTTFLVLFILLSAKTGIIENHSVVQQDRVREYMGFRYALFPAAHLLNLTTLWLWLRRERVPLVGALLWAAVNVWVYWKTDSRFSFVAAILLILAALILSRFPGILNHLAPLRWLMAASFPICAGVSMYLTVTYDSSVAWMVKLNKILSSRLSLGQSSLINYSYKLFGQKIDWVGNGLDALGQKQVGVYDYVDCLYVRLLQSYGPIFLIAFLVLITWALFRANRRRDDLLLVIMASVAVHCMLDEQSFYLYYNTFWIAAGMLLLNPKALDSGKNPRENKKPKPRRRLRFLWV